MGARARRAATDWLWASGDGPADLLAASGSIYKVSIRAPSIVSRRHMPASTVG